MSFGQSVFGQKTLNFRNEVSYRLSYCCWGNGRILCFLKGAKWPDRNGAMTLDKTTFDIMAVIIMTLSIKAQGMATLCITILNMMTVSATMVLNIY